MIKSIRMQLTLLGALSSLAALSLVLGVFWFYELKNVAADRLELERQMALISHIVATNIVSALQFNDQQTASQSIADVESDPNLLILAIYDADGSLFTVYRDERLPAGTEPPARYRTDEPEPDLKLDAQHLVLARAIQFDGENVGYLWLLADASRARQRLTRFLQILFGTLIVSLLCSAWMAAVMQKQISAPILHLTDIAERTFQADSFDLRATVPGHGEIQDLVDKFNHMLAVMQQRSALDRRERETKTAINRLGDLTRGEIAVQALAQQLITFLSKHLDAKVGAFFIAKPDDTLQLLAAYAFQTRKGLHNRFAFGEGLVGQAALERALIHFEQVPADYLKVVSGLGETEPSSILVCPLVYNDEVKGVLELGFVAGPLEEQAAFLEQVDEMLGVALHVAESREQLDVLLRESKSRAADLEETNRVLEEQTQALQLSQAQLREQQEELQAANEELEEKTEVLQLQKREIQTKNTALAEAERQIREKADHLESVSRYKSQFLANMSHELRTPLNSLLILAKGLEENREGNLNGDQVEEASIIYQSGLDLLHLINDILDLSKIEAGRMDLHPTHIDIALFLDRQRRVFKPLAAEKDLELILACDAATPESLFSDEKRLEQIIKNLLSNSIKFTEQGQVSLQVTKAAPQSGYPADWLCFAVSDTGIGIEKEKHQLVFEAFQQADGSMSRLYGGTGLGLAITKSLATLLGGDITLTSEVGQGTTFRLFLPRVLPGDGSAKQVPAAAPALAPTKRAQPASPLQPLPSGAQPPVDPVDQNSQQPAPLLLIIEDDPQFAKILTRIAAEKEFRTLVTPSGEEGLQAAMQYQPTGIILDLALPGMNGWKVLQFLKTNASTRAIPIHIISAEERSTEALHQGAIGFLQKPVTAEALQEVVTRLKQVANRGTKHVLVIEDDPNTQAGIRSLINSQHIELTFVTSGEDAIARMNQNDFDCIVLDLQLPGMSGREFLAWGERALGDSMPPVIVYTAGDLSSEEVLDLRMRSKSIVIKGAGSPARLLDEVTLFLHQVEEHLSEEQIDRLRRLRQSDMDFEGKTVLLVDDDMRNLFALSKELQARHMTVKMAENGQAALATLAKHPEVDLVLMDIMMPVMDGLTAMRAIRENPSMQQLPIIAMTAKAMAQDREEALHHGANDYLTKPLDMEKLMSLLRVWLS